MTNTAPKSARTWKAPLDGTEYVNSIRAEFNKMSKREKQLNGVWANDAIFAAGGPKHATPRDLELSRLYAQWRKQTGN